MARTGSKGKKKATAAPAPVRNANGKFPKPTSRHQYRSLANVPGLTAAQRGELQGDITEFIKSRLNAKAGWGEQDKKKKKKALKDAIKQWPWLEENYEDGWPLDIYIATRFRRQQGAQRSKTEEEEDMKPRLRRLRRAQSSKTEDDDEDEDDMEPRLRRPQGPKSSPRVNYREKTEEEDDDEDEEDELAGDDGVPSAGTSSAPAGHAAGATSSGGRPAITANETSGVSTAWMNHMRIRGQRAVNAGNDGAWNVEMVAGPDVNPSRLSWLEALLNTGARINQGLQDPDVMEVEADVYVRWIRRQ